MVDFALGNLPISVGNQQDDSLSGKLG